MNYANISALESMLREYDEGRHDKGAPYVAWFLASRGVLVPAVLTAAQVGLIGAQCLSWPADGISEMERIAKGDTA